jgi:lipopolysaccharide export system permease protein
MGQPASTIMELIEHDADAAQVAQRLRIPADQAQDLLDRATPGGLLRTIGVFRTVGDYYGPIVILVYAFFSGLVVVAAMAFTLTGLGRNRELTAMVSSGISLYRVAMPILIAGIALNVLALPVQEFVLPHLAGKLSRKKSHIKNQRVEHYAFQYAPDGAGSLISAARFDADHEQLTDMRIVIRNPDGLQIRKITASQALWDEDKEGWDLIDGYAVSPGRMDESPVDAMDRRSSDVDFFKTDLSPTLIKTRRNADYVRLLPVTELQKMQQNQAVPDTLRDTVTRTKWGRISLLIVNVLILAMGLPYFLLRAPENMLLKSVKCAGLCIGVWAGGMTLPELVSGTFNPVAAAWIPVVVYLPLSAYVLQKVKT